MESINLLGFLKKSKIEIKCNFRQFVLVSKAPYSNFTFLILFAYSPYDWPVKVESGHKFTNSEQKQENKVYTFKLANT